MLPRFEVVHRTRPVSLLASEAADPHHPGVVAPFVAAVAEVRDRSCAALHGFGARFGARLQDGAVELTLTRDHRTTTHRSRRYATSQSATHLGLTLTGPHLTAWAREQGRWVARSRTDLRDEVDVHDEQELARLEVELPPWGGTSGPFGQVGLRDLRVVSTAEGEPVRDGGALLLTATHAGPGFADTAHAGVWALDPSTYRMEHRADLFFRRPDRAGVYGDHAVHLVRDREGWLVAASTWGDFDKRQEPGLLRVTLARSAEDLTTGTHVLDTDELPLPTDGFRSVGVWDPHLVRDGGRWLVGYVSARRFFRFHPVVAQGPSLDDLTLRAAATDRTATEGTTLVRVGGGWRVLASDGRDGRPGRRGRFPVLDLDLQETGDLDAPYPTNIPWPSLVRDREDWLVVAFNGRPYGGRLLEYGTHGDVVVMRTTIGPPATPSPGNRRYREL